MLRGLRRAAAAAIALALATGGVTLGPVAYPAGYGGFGWGGWGGAQTAGGDQARGMGVFAAGAGAYNVHQTAEPTASTPTRHAVEPIHLRSTLEAGRINREKQANGIT